MRSFQTVTTLGPLCQVYKVYCRSLYTSMSVQSSDYRTKINIQALMNKMLLVKKDSYIFVHTISVFIYKLSEINIYNFHL